MIILLVGLVAGLAEVVAIYFMVRASGGIDSQRAAAWPSASPSSGAHGDNSPARLSKPRTGTFSATEIARRRRRRFLLSPRPSAAVC